MILLLIPVLILAFLIWRLMAGQGKDRSLRQIHQRTPVQAGGGIISETGVAAATPVVVAPQPPTGLAIASIVAYQSAVTPSNLLTVTWAAPLSQPIPDQYAIEWSTNSFSTYQRVQVAGNQYSAVLLVPASSPAGTVTISVRAWSLYRGVQSATAAGPVSSAAPLDTTPPAAPTSLTASWQSTGDLLLSWNNPTSANFRDIRVRVYASNGGALLTETYSSGTSYVWTLAENRRATSGSPDPSVYLVLTARSWSDVYSTTDLTGTATLAAPSQPASVAADFTGPDCVWTWTQVAGLTYTLTIDSVARGVGTTNRYAYAYAQNIVEHSGTADPSLAWSLVAVDALGQSSTAATGTAINAAPDAPASVTVSAFLNALLIGVTATIPTDFATYRYRLIQTSPSASDVTWDDPIASVTRSITLAATYQVGVRLVDRFGQQGNETLSSTVGVADVLTLTSLREGAIYSDSISTDAATLKAALADNVRGSGGIAYASGATWKWTQISRDLSDRYQPMIITATAGQGYVGLSSDGSTWAWYSGPIGGDGRTLTSVADETAAQTAAVTLPTTTTGRWDLPAMVNARHVRLGHRNVGTGYTLREWYAERVVEGDLIRAGSVLALHISVSELSALSANMGTITAGTITGATIQTAASGERVVLDSTGLKTYDSAGNVVIEATTATDGALHAGVDTIVLDRSGLIAYGGSLLINDTGGTRMGTMGGDIGIWGNAPGIELEAVSASSERAIEIRAARSGYDTAGVQMASGQTGGFVNTWVGGSQPRLQVTASTIWANNPLTVSGGLYIEDAAGGSDGGLTPSLYVGNPSDTSEWVGVGYNHTNDYGYIYAVDNGVAWKTLYVNPAGGSVVLAQSGATAYAGGGLQVARGSQTDGTAWFQGTTYTTHINYATDEHTYIRGGKSGSNVYINESYAGHIQLGGSGGYVGINRAPDPTLTSLIVKGTGTGSSWYQTIFKNGSDVTTFYVRDDDTAYIKAASWTYGSDGRMKEQIRDIEDDPLPRLRKVRGRAFDYIDGPKNRAGFVAQEFQDAFPEMVEDVGDGTLGIRITELLPYLVRAIQQLDARIAALETQLPARVRG